MVGGNRGGGAVAVREVSRLRRGLAPRGGVANEFHPSVRGDGLETQGAIDLVGVAGGETPAAEGLEVWVGDERLHHARGDAFAAVGFEDEDVAEPGEGGAVGHGAGDADELTGRTIQRAGDDAAREGFFDHFLPDVGGPIRGAEHRPSGGRVDSTMVERDFDGLIRHDEGMNRTLIG